MGVSILQQGIAKASGTNVNPNLLSRYVSAGQNAPGSVASGGRTTYYGDYGINIIGAENADTYFRLFLKQQLTQNETYTISCIVNGLLNGTSYTFPLFAQGNAAMGVLLLNHNGLCSMTFTMTYSTQTAATVNGETVYICFLDDSARTLASGQTPFTITNFKIEKGTIATPWVPASTDSIYVGDSCGFTEIGAIQCSFGQDYIIANEFIEI